ALSVPTRAGRRRGGRPAWGTATVSITASNTTDSCRCPGVSTTPSGRPAPSQTTWTLVPKPPWERPRAWSAGSPSHPADFFFGPGGGLVGPHDGAIDAEQVPVDLAPAVRPGVQGGEDPVPQAALAPAVEAAVDAAPGAEALGEVAPGGAGGQD